MAKVNKADLVKEADEIGIQIAQFSNRRDTLHADQKQLLQKIVAQEKTISDALIDGRDVEKEKDALVRDRVTWESLNNAITELDVRLQELNRQYTGKQKGIVKFDFDRVGDEAYGLLLVSIDRLYEAVASLDVLEEKFQELNRVGAAAEFKVESHDHLRLAKQIGDYLRGQFSAADGIPYKLKDIENSYRDTLAIARGKKK